MEWVKQDYENHENQCVVIAFPRKYKNEHTTKGDKYRLQLTMMLPYHCFSQYCYKIVLVSPQSIMIKGQLHVEITKEITNSLF